MVHVPLFQQDKGAVSLIRDQQELDKTKVVFSLFGFLIPYWMLFYDEVSTEGWKPGKGSIFAKEE